MAELARPQIRASGRQTQPPSFDPYAKGGLGVAGGGAWFEGDLDDGTAVGRMALANPLLLGRSLSYRHPTIELALDSLVNLGSAPGDVQITAVFESQNGEEIDKEGTAALDALWNANPSEYNGLGELQAMLTVEVAQTGFAFLEAVPGTRGRGVDRVWPVDSLTIDFRRNDAGDLIPQQRQTGATRAYAPNGLMDLSPETNFWSAYMRSVDNPKGRPWFGSAINEAILDISMIRDVRAAIHQAGHPRYVQKFAFQETMRFVTRPTSEGGMGLSLADAGKFVADAFAQAQTVAGDLLTDDVWVIDSAGDVDVLDGAKGMQSLEKILVVLRQRLSQAVKTPGIFLGINDGDTETNAIRQLEVYAARLETLRGIVLRPIYAAAALHLRLLGRLSRPKVVTKPIRGTDALVAAQTLAANIANQERMVRNGWTSPDAASEAITGSAPFDPDRARLGGSETPTPPEAIAETIPTTETVEAAPVKFRRGGRPTRQAA